MDIDKENIRLTMILAKAIRDNMEQFHFKHLTDEQMKELNPLIRDAIYSTLVHLSNPTVEYSVHMIRILESNIPEYWEKPKRIF